VDGRVSWDEYFLQLARTTASRATCIRRKHGAVIVQGHRIVATGYNGGPSGYPHCDEGACPRATSEAPQGHDYERCIAIHAEANALLFSSPEERDGASLYCTGRSVLRLREADRQLRCRRGGRRRRPLRGLERGPRLPAPLRGTGAPARRLEGLPVLDLH
jgi:hypothetical protein